MSGKSFSGRVLYEFIVAMIGINGVPLSGHRTVIVNLTLVTRMAILINVRYLLWANRTGKVMLEKKESLRRANAES